MSNLTADRLSAADATEAWHKGALLIDVRSATGRARHGELAGATVVAKADVVDFVTRRIGPERPRVVLFCGSVEGTAPLIKALAEAGEARVSDVEGGFAALVATGAFQVSAPLIA